MKKRKDRKSTGSKNNNNSKRYSDKIVAHERNDLCSENSDLDFLKIQYQVLSDRRINHNSMLWSTPSMLFVAQTLLWTMSLNKDICLTIRGFISIVSILIGLASLKNFERHRLMEIADAEQLYSIELQLQDRVEFPILIIHHTISNRTCLENGTPSPLEKHINKKYLKPLLSKKPSYNMWKIVFSVIFGCSILIGIYNLLLIFKKCV